MAILVNKLNREVKVIIPNMREFRTFYLDNEGVIPMFFKRDWEEVKEEEHWKPSEEQMKYLDVAIAEANGHKSYNLADGLEKIKDDLKKL